MSTVMNKKLKHLSRMKVRVLTKQVRDMKHPCKSHKLKLDSVTALTGDKDVEDIAECS
jgi:hypothetical protein